MLACNEIVTLVRHIADLDDDHYTSTVIQGASWFAKSKSELQDHGLVAAKEVKVRIPEQHLSVEVTIVKGDYLVRGLVSTKLTKPADLNGYEYFKILVIGDNRRGGLPHWVVSGA